jgi:hypothetical protein
MAPKKGFRSQQQVRDYATHEIKTCRSLSLFHLYGAIEEFGCRFDRIDFLDRRSIMKTTLLRLGYLSLDKCTRILTGNRLE